MIGLELVHWDRLPIVLCIAIAVGILVYAALGNERAK